MEGLFYSLMDKLSILKVFKELYPKNKVEEEINPHTKIKFHKTFSIFLNSNSKLPQLYFDELSYFCFESGKRGYIPNLLVHKFNEECSDNYKNSINYLLNKLNKKLDILAIKNFRGYFEGAFLKEVSLHNSIFYDSLLANNSCALKDGSWINPYTNKWEGWNLDWKKSSEKLK